MNWILMVTVCDIINPGSAHSVANTIMCIYEDSEKNLWACSYTRGIAKLNRRTGECDYSLLIDNEKDTFHYRR